AGDIVPAAGPGEQRVGDQGAHQWIPLYRGLSVAGGDVPADDEGDDLAVADGEVAGQDELVRQVRLVVVAVVAAADDGVAVVVQDLGHLDGHPVADQFPGHPAADGLAAPELPVHVVDQGVAGKGGHDGVLVERVDGGDVPGQDGARVVVSLMSAPWCRARRERRDVLTATAAASAASCPATARARPGPASS